MTIKISPEKAGFTCGIIAVLFFASNLFCYALKYVPDNPLVKDFTRLNLDREANLPTYFSTLLLLCAGLLMAFVAIYKTKRKEPYVVHWAMLSIIFVCMSIDETARFHEILIHPLRSLLDVSGFFYHAWVIPGICFVIALTVFYARFILMLPSKTQLIFIASGGLYIIGVIGMEMIGGRYGSMYGKDNLAYGLITTVEETLEMLGASLFVYGLMDYIRVLGTKIQIQFG